MARGRISRFPIDLRRRPYNTRTTVRVCDTCLFFNIFRRFDIEGYDQLEDNMTFLRRSTRQRKFQYGTFNQSLMLHEPSVESAEQDKPDEEQNETQQQKMRQQQTDVQPPSDTEVTVVLLAGLAFYPG